jgi:AcrR family transcriptional regulator
MSSTTSPGLSRRARNKLGTTYALVEVSQRLFAERGYHETTLEDICNEVGVRVQTLLRHFESKAHLAMAPWYHGLGVLEGPLAARTRRHDTIAIWRNYVADESREVVQPSSATARSIVDSLKAFQGWADKDPVLVAMSSDVEIRLQNMLATAIAHDRREPADDVHSRLVASMLVAGRAAVFRKWVQHGGVSELLVADQMALIDYVVKTTPRHGARRLRDLGAR